MTGQANLFSRFGFQVGLDGKLDNYTRAFFSKFGGRVGPAIPDIDVNSSWAQIAATSNGLITEFVAQGWVQKGFDADETAFAKCDPSRNHDPGCHRMGLRALRGVPGSNRQPVLRSLRRRMLTACTTARNGSSNTPKPHARAGSAAQHAIGLRRSIACKTSFRTARWSIST